MAKQVKSKNFYLMVFNLIKSGLRPSQACLKLNLPKQNIQYYLNKLKKGGFIKKLSNGSWEILKEVKKSSLGTKGDKPPTNLHALQINFPILKGKVLDEDWRLGERLRNWMPKYKKLNNLGGLTLKNNNNHSITVFAKSRDISSLEDIDTLSLKIRAYIVEYFNMRGVSLDFFNAETKNLNIATEDRDSKGMLRKGEKFELDLQKKAEKIFKQDKIDAKAWLDGSPYDYTVESNDKEWKRWYLGMPFMIRDMFMLQQNMTEKLVFMAENQKSHAKAIRELSRLAKNLNRKIGQGDLRKWV